MSYWALTRLFKVDDDDEGPAECADETLASESQGVLLLPVAPTQDVPGTPDDLLTNSEDDDDKNAETSTNSIQVAGEVLDAPAPLHLEGDDVPLSAVVRTVNSVKDKGKKKEVSDAERQKLEVKVQSVLRLRH